MWADGRSVGAELPRVSEGKLIEESEGVVARWPRKWFFTHFSKSLQRGLLLQREALQRGLLERWLLSVSGLGARGSITRIPVSCIRIFDGTGCV